MGQEYETVYAKISRTIPSGEDLSWGNDDEQFTNFGIQFSDSPDTVIIAWFDWMLHIPHGDISPGVYPLTLEDGWTLGSPLVTDFDL